MNRSASTKRYWRSINDLEQTAEFKELMAAEFPAGPEEEWTSSSRRRFLQLMGASVALAGATSCRWEKEVIKPLATRDDHRVPGMPKYYASHLTHGGFAHGTMITAFDGRPSKVEGNPKHPESLGATTQFAQAATLGLYDPDRSRGVARMKGGEADASMADFEAALAGIMEKASAAKGKGFAVLAQPGTSLTVARLRGSLLTALPEATWVDYSPLSRDAEVDGCRLAFGVTARPYYRMANARVIVALDDDFLTDGPSSLRLTREVTARRKPENGWMNRLYAVEADFTNTGAFADHRLRMRSSDMGGFVAALRTKVEGGSPTGLDAKTAKFIDALAEDLLANRGDAVLTCGPNQPAAVHAHVQALNLYLGADGRTVSYLPAKAVGSPVEELRSLTTAMAAGEVSTLVVLGGNPAYDMPADLDFAGALGTVEESIHLGLYRDETAALCSWHVPMAHELESWTDAMAADGTISIGQPMIEPLWDGVSEAELLARMTGEAPNSHDLVRASLRLDDTAWRVALHEGMVAGSSSQPLNVRLGQLPEMPAGVAGVELRFVASRSVADGRYANLGWLQELPDPMTKLTWDNAALVGFATAKRLGLKHEGMATLEVDGRSLDVAVYLMPGHADDSITLALGYGRTAAGHVAGLNDDWVEPVGFDSYKLRASGAMHVATGVSATAASGSYRLATTQDHFSLDEIGRDGLEHRMPNIIKEGTVADYEEQPLFAKAAEDYFTDENTLWKEVDQFKNPAHRWGMAIDLSSCTGCGSCTIACQSENNISVVGKEQVLRGREMAWIRMDRYFLGDEDEPTAVSQPLTCQQCELAPCESVCPVAATVHSSEGLNDMVYNRCIGTRYCSNNCPYKVRRFNFFNFNKDAAKEGNEVLKMAANPDVTVRHRGVMEKCTFCVQRIERERISHRNVDRDVTIPDGAVKSACQQVCPADAISFGDLMDEESRVSKEHANPRSYRLLPELNLRTRNVFQARIRNPHPKLAVAAAGGEGTHHG